MGRTVWQKCVNQLQRELPSEQFDTYIKPLQARRTDNRYELLAPNRYVSEEVKAVHLVRINEILDLQGDADSFVAVDVEIGGPGMAARGPLRAKVAGTTATKKRPRAGGQVLNKYFTFETFVEGRSNEFARAAALQVANKSGQPSNPLLLYGGVGLGKTHLMQAVGNQIQALSPHSNVVYLRSEGFVQDMVDALRDGRMREFAEFYRSVEVLLIDDIQFFAKKLRSQEELFHLFNGLLERGHQMVFTCDRYPKQVDGLEERLKSRFIWGLTVEVEPPELETRVAILMKKAETENIDLDPDVAFFIAERIRSNVRELEGALRRVVANAQFTGSMITIEQVKRALRDLFAIQNRQMSIDNIYRTVAEYYNIRISDILSKSRSQNIARPRQMAMLLVRQLTNYSLPAIGDAFGGRDHTTVLHACKRIKMLMENGSTELVDDHRNLSRLLSS